MESKAPESVPDASLNKKENSYTYWVHNDGKGVEPIAPKLPQKVDTQNQSEDQKIVSSWNKVGSWEERKIEVATVKDLIEKSLKASHIVSPDNRVEFYNVSKVEGEVTVVAVRGKMKPGYTLKINLKYRGLEDYKGAKGVFKYTSFSDDGDRDFQVEGAGDIQKENCKKLAASCQGLIESRLNEILKSIV